MLSNKEKSILEFLLQNKNKMVTSREVADTLKLSDRTIRNYIKDLQVLLSKNGAEIIAKTGKGYAVKVNNEAEFNTFLQRNHNNLIKKKEVSFIDAKDRKDYILNKLLFEEVYVLFDELCEELFVSRSTLCNDFTEIRKLIAPYNLSIESKSKKGVYLEGDEYNKRNFIIDYFFGNSFDISINQYVGKTVFVNDISFEEITTIILEECRKVNLRLADYLIQNLSIYLALSINRIKDGFNLLNNKKVTFKENELEFLVAKRILNRIALLSNIIFSNEEICQVALYLKVKTFSKDLCEISDEEIYDDLIISLAKIEDETGYKIGNDQQLIKELMTQFSSLVLRLKNGVVLENPLLTEIKAKYGEIFAMTKYYFSEIAILKEYKVSDSEWAYICLQLMVAIEKIREDKKINVLVICATGYGSGQMLCLRLKKEFGQYINVVDVIGYYEITDEILQGIDLIISSIDLYTVVFNVPIIHVSIFLDNKEAYEVRKFIEKKLASIDKGKTKKDSKLLSERIKLVSEVLKEECFYILNESIDKEKLIEKMIDSLQKNEEENYSKIMIKQVAQRELMSTVVFSKEIAVPHPVKSVGSSSSIAIAIAPAGVYWSEEFQKVKFIFLLSPSRVENTKIREITKAIVSLTEDDYAQKQLLNTKNFHEFKELFAKLI